jgi:hypothetical protein
MLPTERQRRSQAFWPSVSPTSPLEWLRLGGKGPRLRIGFRFSEPRVSQIHLRSRSQASSSRALISQGFYGQTRGGEQRKSSEAKKALHKKLSRTRGETGSNLKVTLATQPLSLIPRTIGQNRSRKLHVARHGRYLPHHGVIRKRTDLAGLPLFVSWVKELSW